MQGSVLSFMAMDVRAATPIRTWVELEWQIEREQRVDIMKKPSGRKLPTAQRDELLQALEARFEKNAARHPGVRWEAVHAKLEKNPEKLWSLNEMEISGGEPDVVGQETKGGEYVFIDCAAQSPKGRRSVCY